MRLRAHSSSPMSGWGSARMMAGLGFRGAGDLERGSAGLLGRRDGKVTRDEALAQAR